MTLHRQSWMGWATRVALVTIVGCAQDAPQVPINDGTAIELPVIQVVLGEFDGRDFHFHTLQPGETVEVGDVGRGTSQLVDLASYGCTGAACTGDDYVAFSNVPDTRRSVVNGGQQGSDVIWTSADGLNCGSPPSTGVCQGIRMRNLYGTQLERVYASLTTLTPTGSTTAVSVPFQPWGASSDFGVAPTITNAMWRAGTVGRNSPETGGVTQFWSFTGTTPPSTNFTFRFAVQVRGQIVNATRRATVVGADDPTLDYPALTSGNSTNNNIDITPDGRYVVFTTGSTALTGQTGNYVVRHDMLTGENLVLNMLDGTTQVIPGCTSSNPSISADGNRIAFQNQRCQLASIGGVGRNWHIYVRDVAAQTTTLVSVNTSGGYANRNSQIPRISQDGNVVVFHSNSGNLVAGYPASGGTRPTSCHEVFRRDLSAGTTVHVSAIDGTPLNDPAGYAPTCSGLNGAPAGREPDVSADGSVIVFRGHQPLEGADTNDDYDVFVYRHNGATADVYRVSLSNGGAQVASPTDFDHPAISPDGNVVAFSSNAAGIIGAGNGNRHVYRRSATRGANGTISRVTVTAAGVLGAGAAGGSPYPVLSQTGRFVGFFSNFTNLATPYSISGTNFFVCDTEATTADLRRCFVTNTVQLTSSSSFLRMSGGAVNTGGRPGMACPNENEACYAAYQMTASNATGLSNGGAQVWVSPIGDPRYQMPAPSR